MAIRGIGKKITKREVLIQAIPLDHIGEKGREYQQPEEEDTEDGPVLLYKAR